MTRDVSTEVEARWIEPRGFSILRAPPEPPSLPIAPPPPAATEDPRAIELLSWLPPLAARVRAREVAWIVERGIDPRDAMDTRTKLLSAAEEIVGFRLRITDRAETLRATATGAAGAQLQEILARHLRATVREPDSLRHDLEALDRDLDLATLLEREDGLLETASVRLDVVMLLLQGLARVWPDQLERIVGDGRVEKLLVDRATNETWPPARRTAVSALASVVRAILEARFPHAPEGLRALARLVRDRDENPWIRRRALEVTGALGDEIARPWFEGIFAERDGNESFLVRAAAVGPLAQRSGDWAMALLETCAGDPSSLVRLTLAEECARQWSEPAHRSRRSSGGSHRARIRRCAPQRLPICRSSTSSRFRSSQTRSPTFRSSRASPRTRSVASSMRASGAVRRSRRRSKSRRGDRSPRSRAALRSSSRGTPPHRRSKPSPATSLRSIRASPAP